VILVGQPELNEKIRNIEQLNQRIAIRHYIKPFDREDTVHYINFRQNRAGREENAFTSEAVETIYEITKGVPRMINHLCDVSLLIGFSMQAKVIDPQIIEDIMKDGAIF
jgi:general secretion pathway protein A